MDGTHDWGTNGCYECVREDLGAYALGALEPWENERISAHLAVCSDCRAEHDELAKVAALFFELLPVVLADRHPGGPRRDA